MKKLTYFIIAFFTLITFYTTVKILALEKQKLDFVKVKEADINKEEIETIKKRTHTIIRKIERGELQQFSEEGKENNIVIDKIDVTYQNDFQKQIKNKLGAYLNLRFESLFKSKTENPVTNKIYLFKGDFEFKKDVEIRIYINNKKEIIDINVMSWEKEHYYYL